MVLKLFESEEITLSYIIFSDVSMNIDEKFAKKNDVRYIQMEYEFGDERIVCNGPDTADSLHNYYETLRRDKNTNTKTSQITPNTYIETFTNAAKEGKDIIYIALSSGLSNTYDSACMGASEVMENYPDITIEVVDSLCCTGSMGVIAESAVEFRDQGMPTKEAAEKLRALARRTEFCFKVDDVFFLKRGGRLSAKAAMACTALSIKPLIRTNAEGKLEVHDKKRGTNSAIRALFNRFKDTADIGYGVVYISAADCYDQAEKLKDMMEKEYPDITVRVTTMSPIIGAHTGPDALAIGYYRKE